MKSGKGGTILVCGGAGFMGSNFIRYLLEKDPSACVINLDALTYAGNLENLRGVDKSRYEFIKGDINDSTLVKKLMARADIAVNFAAETHVDRSIHESSAAFVRTNVLGVHSLLEALRASPNVQKFIHISTDEVWGDLPLKSKKSFKEDSPFRPSSPYAASKAGGDLLCAAYVRTYRLPIIVTHSVNNFGPRQYPEKIIPFFAMRALRDKKLPLYGTGENMRDWLYVDDHSEAVMVVMRKGKTGQVYNVGSQRQVSNKWMAETILKILGKPRSLIQFVQDRPGHDLKYAIDASKLKALGWKPKYKLEDQLAETIQWFKKHGKSADANAHIRL